MPVERSLLMIPGPVEISPAVLAATSIPPPSHLAADFMERFGRALERMRAVWRADEAAQPYILAGSGTLAMDMAVANVVDPGERVVVVNTGYFSDRVAEMLRRRGADVVEVGAAPGSVPALSDVAAALPGARALFATHVDTSTGVRVDARALAGAAREAGALSVFDGVCATAAERFEMGAWGADVYLTASQKAIGLPAGLALLVASERALAARDALSTPPPLSVDWHAWTPIMRAYAERRPSYFATPATTLVPALDVGLGELLAEGMEAVFARHQRVGDGIRAAWATLGLELLPESGWAANALSAVRYPAGVGPELLGEISARGVICAGGLHPALKTAYFRVGHMGYATTRPEWLARAVRAVSEALAACGHRADVEGAVAALERSLEG